MPCRAPAACGRSQGSGTEEGLEAGLAAGFRKYVGVCVQAAKAPCGVADAAPATAPARGGCPRHPSQSHAVLPAHTIHTWPHGQRQSCTAQQRAPTAAPNTWPHGQLSGTLPNSSGLHSQGAERSQKKKAHLKRLLLPLLRLCRRPLRRLRLAPQSQAGSHVLLDHVPAPGHLQEESMTAGIASGSRAGSAQRWQAISRCRQHLKRGRGWHPTPHVWLPPCLALTRPPTWTATTPSSARW